jgi:hypothetical protein
MISYIKRTERSQRNNQMLPLKLLEKQEQAKHKKSKRRDITKIRAKINERETPKKYKESMMQKVGSLKK